MQLFAHSAHHLSKGQTFFEDHSFFGDTYSAVEDDFDSVAERMIGLGEEEMDVLEITTHAIAILKDSPSTDSSMEDFFNYQLKLEKHLCETIKKSISSVSPGTEQLIGEIANKSEVRQYKLKQRLKA
jgi:DNA-binding ferritin-like protein